MHDLLFFMMGNATQCLGFLGTAQYVGGAEQGHYYIDVWDLRLSWDVEEATHLCESVVVQHFISKMPPSHQTALYLSMGLL